LKTDSGYPSPKDAGVFLPFTMANPGSSFRFNTHWSVPLVSALVRSGGFCFEVLKMSLQVGLRLEFVLKTDSGYPRETGGN